MEKIEKMEKMELHCEVKLQEPTHLSGEQLHDIQAFLSDVQRRPASSLVQNLQSVLDLKLLPSKDDTSYFTFKALSAETDLDKIRRGDKKKELAALLRTHVLEHLPQELHDGWTLILSVPTDSGFEEQLKADFEDEEEEEVKNAKETDGAKKKREGRQNMPQSGPGKMAKPPGAVFGSHQGRARRAVEDATAGRRVSLDEGLGREMELGNGILELAHSLSYLCDDAEQKLTTDKLRTVDDPMAYSCPVLNELGDGSLELLQNSEAVKQEDLEGWPTLTNDPGTVAEKPAMQLPPSALPPPPPRQHQHLSSASSCDSNGVSPELHEVDGTSSFV